MLKVINPSTEKKITELKTDTSKTIHQKFLSAKKSQENWQQTSLKQRINCFQKWKLLLKKNLNVLATTLTEEMGKPITQSKAEIKSVLARVDYFCQYATKVLETALVSNKTDITREEISFEPLGVIANISAWNYPYFVGSNVFVPALLMGNAILYKPSEFAALTGTHIAQLLHESGIPKDVFATIIGTGETGALLLKQDIDGVFFTGSYQTGLKILEIVRPKMIPAQLELGGKDPAYVRSDANIKSAAHSLAEGVFYNAGQSCCAVERLYVHERIYDAFIVEFLNVAKQYVIGDPLDDKTFIGPLARRAQIAFLKNQIDDALLKGGKLLLGGFPRKGVGYYFEPTIVINANHKMLLMHEESFGPVIGIQKVKDDNEALKLMNDTAYGLTAAVYTKSQTKARELLSKLDTGTAYWNCCDRVSSALPWSGRKNSGLGVTLSLQGIQAFTKPKAWHLRN